jgi:nucleoside 2-deoxyribosyltransferase
VKIYVASSWRNAHQPAVVAALRAAGHEVYDFRNPRPGDHGFAWSALDPAWQSWTPEESRAALEHPVARAGFKNDMDALQACDACVLVLPCGRSAHLELGWAAGAGKRTVALMFGPDEPELMYRMLGRVCTSVEEVLAELDGSFVVRDVEAALARAS